ncbi:(2,3-dihydroxybenzoyl)adenylate synthase [Vibrio metschnikovii]|uniref:(2,3-dihydroxybenzoyl)adenylate synthase n=1 Tax=Vibrio metschnikovii TaxID=28172 RepID=UPI00297AB14B|nr:(2,3-dihydroxybenzoyl)adenylate synthase [Vibrio metschnikovii]EKO3658880.1 (2,3-dihydroxybenzoyl)adenylate synthase [Vibrio metschnikovii]EKO3791523.1 (2,3-dihydroxybenzoyl)adenylate synthase [Vibrio metschnikovii]
MISSTSTPLDFTPWPTDYEQYYRKQGYWQDRTLFDCLSVTTVQSPDAIALVCQDQQYTYQQLQNNIAQLSKGFSALGLSAGDNVVLQMINEAEFFFCFFALTMKGIKPILALPAHRYNELSYFCQHAEAKAYIFSDQIANVDTQKQALLLLETCPSLKFAITSGKSTYSDIQSLNTLYLDACYQQNSKAEDVAFYQLSGGTTGTPKLIPRTHNDYVYSVIGSIEICQFNSSTKYLCVLPVAHNFPLSSPGSLGVLFSGGCVILSQDSSPKAAFDLIERHKVTVSALVPPLALLWMQYAPSANEDISSLKLVQVGGAKFSQSAAQQLPEKLGCQLQQVFGMAEGLVNYTRLDDPIDVIVSTQGRPISPDDEILVLNEDGKPVPPGQEGQLLTRGPYTIRGYYRAQEHNQRAFNHQGFYSTGDLVKMTPEGNIIVTGRDKDQINRGGEKIAAEEVENLLLQHPDVHDVALIAVQDEFLGERSCAIIVLNQEKALKPIMLKRFLHAKGLAEYKIPDQIRFIDKLPKTPVGKINKKQLREQFSTN